MSKKFILEKLRTRAKEIRKFGTRKIGIFGSYARGEASSSSDIDFLVDFREKTFDNYMGLKFYLESIFKKRIDLVTKEALNPSLKTIILKEVKYAEKL